MGIARVKARVKPEVSYTVQVCRAHNKYDLVNLARVPHCLLNSTLKCLIILIGLRVSKLGHTLAYGILCRFQREIVIIRIHLHGFRTHYISYQRCL